MNTKNKEIWLPVVEFPFDYEVSSNGRVRSITRVKNRCDGTSITYHSKILSPQKHKTNSWRIRLCVDNIKYSRSVHRLVAIAFISNPDNKPEVNHIDGSRLNNHVPNLEWVTGKENMEHAVRTGLIFNEFGENSRNYHSETKAWKNDEVHFIMKGNREIMECGFCYKQVSAVVRGKQNTHKGYIFTRNKITIDTKRS